MPVAATTKTPAKRPVGRPPKAKVAAVEVPEPVVQEPEPVVVPEPEPEPECAFADLWRGKCPTAVFNAPNSPNERIAFSRKEGGHALRFVRGMLAVFSEGDASVVRRASPGGRVYIESDPKFRDEPLWCDDCRPKTPWFSKEAFRQHVRFAHTDK